MLSNLQDSRNRKNLTGFKNLLGSALGMPADLLKMGRYFA